MNKVIRFTLYIVVVALLIHFLEWYGIIGLIVFILAIAGWRAWKGKELIKSTTKSVESMVFGKPLDRSLWEKDEMKNTKLEIIWGTDGINLRPFIAPLVYIALIVFAVGVGFGYPKLQYISLFIGCGAIVLWFYTKLKESEKDEPIQD